MTRSPLFRHGAAAFAAVCLFASTDVQSQPRSAPGPTSPSGASVSLAGSLSQAAKAALLAKFAARANPPATPGGPFLRFAPTPPDGPNGPVSCWPSMSQTYVNTLYQGPDAGVGATVHFEAIGASGNVLQGTSGSLADLRPGPLFRAMGQISYPSEQAMGSQPFTEQPSFVAWIEAIPNDGKIAIFEPKYHQRLSTSATPASAGPMLAFLPGGETSLTLGTGGAPAVLKTCYKVKNAGGASSPQASIKIVLRKGVGTPQVVDVVSSTLALPPVPKGGQTEVCTALPPAPAGVAGWDKIPCKDAQVVKYGFEASILGAQNNGAKVTIPVGRWSYRVGSL